MSLPDPSLFDPGYQIDIQYVDGNGVTQRVRAFANTINWIRVDGKGVITSPPAAESAPLNIVPPAITGETLVNQTLTAFNGIWSANPSPTFTYQWLANDVAIPGATGQSYVLTSLEIGKTVKVRVTAQNAAGSVAATSLATLTIGGGLPPVEPGNTGLPVISGTAQVGQILTVSTGTWTGTVPITYTYQWKAAGIDIGGATANSFTVTSAQLGLTITCAVTATNVLGSATATTAPTAAVVGAEVPVGIPVNTSLPTISGTQGVGNALTVNRGTWTESPTLTQQWYADGFAIYGATGLTYALTEPDRSKRISCLVTATNSAGSASASSAATGLIAATGAVVKRYIRRVSAGLGDGSSWANAGTLANLNSFITAVGANGEILVRADEGNYTASTISLSAIGPTSGTILIRGCDVNELPSNAIIVGNRTDPFVSNGTNTTGPEVFRLLAGIRNVTFRSFDFRRCGNGCFRIGGDMSNITIEQCVADNVNRFIENNISGVATTASLTDSRIGHCTVRGYSRAFARLRYAGSNINIHDCYGDSEQQDGDNFAAGIVFSDTLSNSIVQRCTMINHLDTQGGDQTQYWQGDGFSQENGNVANQFIDCVAKGSSDGGFDLKGSCTLVRCIASENKKNFRLWGTATLTDCISRDCYLRGGNSEASLISLHSVDANVTLTRMSLVDNRPETTCIRLDEATAVLTVVSATLQRHPSSTLILNPNGAPFNANDFTTPPAVLVAPALSGTEVAEQTLSVTTGTWSVTGLAFTYQWCRDGLYIDGATSSTYLLTSADIGKVISCRVYGKNTTGFMGEAVSANSGIITAAPPVNTALPSILGVQAVGATLSVNTGTWTGSPAPTFSYVWKNNGVAIGGATSSTYVLQAGDQGDVITCTLTGTNSAGSASVTTAGTAAIAANVSAIYVAPTAAGTRDGSSFANAISLSGLTSAIRAAAPGCIVNVAAHLGDYSMTAATNIDKGGTAGNRVLIRGVDASLNPLKARIIGTRTNWTLPSNPETVTSVSGWTTGIDGFNLLAGSDHIKFQHLFFQNVGKCFDLNSAALDDVVAHDIEFYNAQEGFYTNNFTITNVELKRWKGTGYSKRAIRCFADSHDWLIEDVEFNSGRQNKDDFAGAIVVNDTAHNIVCRGFVSGGIYSGILENHHDDTSSYWNGDSLSTERGNYNVTFENFICRGNTDGGLDMKGENVTLKNITCYDNKHNFRIHSYNGLVMDGCTSRDPRKRGGSSSQFHVDIDGAAAGETVAPDFTAKSCTFENTGAPGTGGSVWGTNGTNERIIILREMANTFISTSNNALANSTSIKLTDTLGSVTLPTITTDAAQTTFNRQSKIIPLTSDKQVSWEITGGAGAAKYTICNSAGTALRTGQFIKFTTTSWTGVSDAYAVTVRAKDANGNTNTKTITTTVQEAIPPATFLSNFEGANGSTTPLVDEAGGKTISFSAGAALTTTTPLQGASSLLIGGSTQRCNVADHDDFHFGTGPFTIKAKIRPSTISATHAIVSQINSSTNQRSFRFAVTGSGGLQFLWSRDGNNVASVASASALIAINTTYEVMVDRDETGKYRLYIDGVMVANLTTTDAVFNSNQSISIGNSGQSSTEPFIGRIDALTIWKGFAFCGSDSGYTP